MFRAGGVPRGSTEIEIPAVDLPADLSLQDEDHLSEEIKEKRLELAEKDALLLAERVLAALTYELAEKDSQLAEKEALLAEKESLLDEKESLLDEKEALLCSRTAVVSTEGAHFDGIARCHKGCNGPLTLSAC